MKKKRIEFTIIWKKLFGKADEEEQKILEAWLDDDPENLDLIRRFESFQQNPRKISNEQRDQAWLRLKGELDHTPVRDLGAGRSQTWRYLSRAAAVLIIGTTAALLWTYTRHTPRPISEVTIAPGRTSATLIAANGNSIFLTDSAMNLNRHGIPAQVTGGALAYRTSSATPAPASTFVAEEVNTLIVPRGGEFQLTLADGTRVWLNAETTISYPTRFTGDRRWVELSGEAYFEVTKDKEHPFQVSTPGQTIAVLGTSFNVTAYPGEAQTLTTLVEGEISVQADGTPPLHVLPGYQSVFDASLGTLSSHKVDTDVYTSWKDGIFIFEDEKLSRILTRLGRWYNVDVAYDNVNQKDARFTAHVDKYQSATEVLKLMQITQAMVFELDRETIIVK